MDRSEALVEVERRLGKVRSQIIRLQQREHKLLRDIRILQSRPNIDRYKAHLGCRQLEIAQIRFEILEHVCGKQHGVDTNYIWSAIRRFYPRISYNNLRVNLNRMNERELFLPKKRGANWIASSKGRDLLEKILY